jgi:integrase
MEGRERLLRMSIKKVENKWLVDLYPNGREGKRVRKKFDTRIEAQRFEKHILAKASSDKDWNESSSDNRRLSELVEVWFKLTGQYLKDGERRKRKLDAMVEGIGNPSARKLTSKEFAHWRAMRSEQGISPKTLNNELGYLGALFNSLKKNGEISYSNPLDDISLIKIPERELSYLATEQIEELMESIKQCENEHVELITLICLCTGARWGEAEGLTSGNVRDGKVTFNDTKNGKNRTIPVADWLFERLKKHASKGTNRPLFTSSIGSFRRALKRTTIELPKGQAAHVLRHSFASHFMINGGNILTLQRILGHSDIRITMRYAHLAPDHFQDAVIFNPLKDL